MVHYQVNRVTYSDLYLIVIMASYYVLHVCYLCCHSGLVLGWKKIPFDSELELGFMNIREAR